MVPYESQDCFFNFCEESYWYFDRDYIESMISFDGMDILTTLILPSMDTTLVSSSISFYQCFIVFKVKVIHLLG
jgi:hypothetical protein